MKSRLILMSIVASVAFVGCASSQQNMSAQNVKRSHSLDFTEVSVPLKDSAKRQIRVSSSVKIDGKESKLGYKTILRSGQMLGGNTFGQIKDINSNPIKNSDGSLKISNYNDFSSLLEVDGKIFMVSHFESRPAAMYLSELKQNEKGELSAVSTKNIDFSKFNGLWTPCAGSVTPWNTHLGSEEYEPNVAKLKSDGSIDKYYASMADYFGGDIKKVNPYDYGWITEVKVLSAQGDVDIAKHYAIGRFSHELAYVMPDQKTVYLSDDGTNVALFMFIADKKADLSSGTLYAAKWTQKSGTGAGSAELSWINLGHSDDKTIQQAVSKRYKFEDIFDISDEKRDGFTSINTTFGHEYLRVKDGMQEVASRLESRRYAAIKGVTTEFRKMEGITFNPDDESLYVSMSSIGKGMEDFKKKAKPNKKYDVGGNNDIKLEYNQCGAVYALDILNKDNKSTDFKSIDSQYVVSSASALVSGKSDSMLRGNKCSPLGIANPDNITYIPNTDTLLIGEDTGSGHQNDYIWSYNIANDKLTRIQTSPYGSETTSLYYYNNIKGYGYIMSVVQHPYGEGDALTKEKNMPKMAKSKDDMRAYTGYIGPLPVINK